MTVKKQPTENTDLKPKYNQSETIVIHRSQISFAPYNPRKEDQEVVRKLKKNFKSVGFLGGVVWNEQTGNLISGHKRIQTLDIINNYDGTTSTDYEIKVEAVELDDKTEREQNIFMNSPSAMGEFDNDLLKMIIPDIDYKDAGLTDQDLNIIGIEFETPSVENLQTDMDDLSNSYDQRKDAVKEMKAQIRKQSEEKVDEHESFVTLSFDTYTDKAGFMRRFGFDEQAKFIRGTQFSEMIERAD